MNQKFYLLLLATLCLCNFAQPQTIKFEKATLKAKEPYKKDVPDENEDFVVHVKAADLPVSPAPAISATVELSTTSTYSAARYSLKTPSPISLIADNQITINVKTDLFSDEDKNIIIKLSYKDAKGETQLIQDTLIVANTYPFKSAEPKDYTDWNDGKSAEIFVGTNFDFNGALDATDWYGGLRVFLPGVTDFKYSEAKNKTKGRFGFSGSIYHSRSFSNFGNLTPENFSGVYNKVKRIYSDTVSGVVTPMAEVQFDTLTAKPKSEINNWGVYGGIMYQWSRFETDNFVTNIFIGGYAEVIRRNILLSYTFDTSGTSTKAMKYSDIRTLRFPPKNTRSVYYDAYFGVNFPIQFLWKDILDLKVVPCFGFGPAEYRRDGSKKVPWFYLVQFDLLARLGGVKLNLGGEVRGYFPQNPPIFSAYLGGSFSITKLTEFLSKK